MGAWGASRLTASRAAPSGESRTKLQQSRCLACLDARASLKVGLIGVEAAVGAWQDAAQRWLSLPCRQARESWLEFGAGTRFHCILQATQPFTATQLPAAAPHRTGICRQAVAAAWGTGSGRQERGAAVERPQLRPGALIEGHNLAVGQADQQQTSGAAARWEKAAVGSGGRRRRGSRANAYLAGSATALFTSSACCKRCWAAASGERSAQETAATSKACSKALRRVIPCLSRSHAVSDERPMGRPRPRHA